MIKPDGTFMDKIKLSSKDEVNKKQNNIDIKLIEVYRSTYDYKTDPFKGFKALMFLYRLNKICNRVASFELFSVVGKVLIPLFLFMFAYIINVKFLEHGYHTGVNGYVFLLFSIFTIFLITNRSNKRGAQILTDAQHLLRNEQFDIKINYKP